MEPDLEVEVLAQEQGLMIKEIIFGRLGTRADALVTEAGRLPSTAGRRY